MSPAPEKLIMFACLAEVGYDGLIGYELFQKTTTTEAVKAIYGLRLTAISYTKSPVHTHRGFFLNTGSSF